MPNKLDPQQIGARLAAGWTTDGNQIEKTFAFAQYSHCLLFAAGVGLRAEAMDHHPELTITYGKVKVALNTHSAGGVTELDLKLAKEADVLANGASQP